MDGDRVSVPRSGSGMPRLSRRRLLTSVPAAALLAACGNPVGSANPTASSPKPASDRVPLWTLVTRWDTDPWSLGSYSALPVGTDASARATIANALLGGRIAVAGEFAATDFPATVHGAYLSGQRAAKKIHSAVPRGKVLVVGAGMAGLAAASTLRSLGRQVVVAEARDRIGGRVHTVTQDGAPYEMGAAWVHGLRENPVADLVTQSGARLVPTNYDDETIRSTVTGGLVPGIEDSIRGLQKAVGELYDAEPPARLSAARAVADQGWTPPASELSSFSWSTEVVGEYGLDQNVLGAQAFAEGAEELGGGDAMVAGGYSKVPQLLAQGLEIKLSMPIASVVSERGRVIATPQGGAPMEFTAAIVAVPLSLLLRELPRLAPLPTSVRSAATSLRTGNLEKVIAGYPNRWWPKTQVLGVVGSPQNRWSEWYDLEALTGRTAVVGFSGGSAATSRPSEDAACAEQATTALRGAFAPPVR